MTVKEGWRGRIYENFEIGDEFAEQGNEAEAPSETPEEPRLGAHWGDDTLANDPVLPPMIGLDDLFGEKRPPRGPMPYGEREKLGDSLQKKGKPGKDIVEILTPLEAALLWLQRAQERDGSWDAKSWGGASHYKVGMTGLALLAYQGAGCTHRKGSYRHTIARGLEWLRDNQRRYDGGFPWETFYEQGIATIAVCEAYTITQDPRLRDMAQRAITYIVNLQPDHGGFRYGGAVPKDQGDMSVTGWQIMAIKSAMIAGLDVPPRAVERSRVFLKNSLRDYGASAYLVGDRGAGSAAVTSVGLLCRIFLNDRGDYEAEIMQGANLLARRENPQHDAPLGGASKELGADLYYTYYSALAMFQVGGEFWRDWKKMHLDPLKAAQVREKFDPQGRYIKGSWDPAKHRWGAQGGRVFTTAMGALCLEAPFRFLPMVRLKQ